MTITRDARRFNRKLGQMPQAVRQELRTAMARQADRVVAMMQSFAPEHLKDKVAWSWGDAPSGRARISVIGSGTGDKDLRITVHVSHFTAHWFEHGTAERRQKSTGRYVGRIEPQPFFWTSWRFRERAIKAAMSRAMKKGLKRASQ